MVMEEIDKEDIMLFSRRGMANNGWHRFRVPLRPSFKPVSIKFRSILPQNAFVTLSNTRLVNENDEEMNCELVFEKESSKLDSQHHIKEPERTTTPKTNLAFNLPTPFNPYKPMLENGIAPIVPLRDDMPRLTAFQNLDKFTIPTFSPMVTALPTATTNMQFYPTLVSPSFEDNNKLAVMTSNDEKIRFGDQVEPFSRLQDQHEFDYKISQNSKSLGGVLQSMASNPALEQELLYLAQHLGIDTNTVPDSITMESLKSFIAAKLSTKKNNQLPHSVVSTASQKNDASLGNAFLEHFFNREGKKATLN